MGKSLETQQNLPVPVPAPVAGAPVVRRELAADVVVVAAFVTAVAGLFVVDPRGELHPLDALLSLFVMALATQVVFDTPFGQRVPTQLAFVPLLFATPIAIVPIMVVLALVVGRLPEVARGTYPAHKLLQAPRDACFALGPCWVFALAGAHTHPGAGVLVAALLAQFVTDFLGSAVYGGLAWGAAVRSQLTELRLYALDAALAVIGLVVAEQARVTPWAVLSIVPLLAIMNVLAGERRGRLENVLALNEIYRGTALLLGDLLSLNDRYTGTHSLDVVDLSLAVGRELALDPVRLRNLEFGARLHDIGKIEIPQELLNKPGELEPAERALMETHCARGEAMLSRVGGFMLEVGGIVRAHHERWDGSGYPDGLAGEAIPLESRIISACDAWNAMRTDRAYRLAIPHADAVTQIQAGTGSQFDPTVAAALLAVVDLSQAALGPAPSAVLPFSASLEAQVEPTDA